MKDFMKQRFEINRKIRSLLVRHFVDLGELKISISPQRVTLRGRLVKLSGTKGALSPENVKDIIESIRRLPEVKKVKGELDNFRQDSHGGPWKPVGRDAGGSSSTPHRAADEDATAWEAGEGEP